MLTCGVPTIHRLLTLSFACILDTAIFCLHTCFQPHRMEWIGLVCTCCRCRYFLLLSLCFAVAAATTKCVPKPNGKVCFCTSSPPPPFLKFVFVRFWCSHASINNSLKETPATCNESPVRICETSYMSEVHVMKRNTRPGLVKLMT